MTKQHHTITPYRKTSGKKEQVAEMFDNIAGNYDFLNHFLSAGIDILWRKKAIRLLKAYKPGQILDIATGTGDFAIEALQLDPEKVTGVDISEKMLEKGREKIKKRGLEKKISLLKADAEQLPFDGDSFDAITVGFGVRNFEHLEKGLEDMLRVLKKDGICVILEFSKPVRFPVKQLYHLYSFHILPFIGKICSKDHRAYTYLPESVHAFPFGNDFLTIMRKAGYRELKCIPLSFGIASLYIGRK